VDVG